MDDRTTTLPSLVLLTGPEAGRRIPLTTGRTAVLGRALEADLTFPDEPSLSRLHARIERTGDQYTVTDLDSANGTRLNGRAVTEPATLSHRDVITCGTMELRFEQPSADARGTPHPAPDPGHSRPRIHAVLAGEHRLAENPPVAGPADTGEPLPAGAPPAFTPPMDGRGPAPGAPDQQVECGEEPAPLAPRPEPPARASVPAAEAATAGPEPGASVALAEPAAVPAARAGGGTAADGVPLADGESAMPLDGMLGAVPLLRPLQPAERAALAATMTERRFPAGSEIVRQGEEGLSLYVVLEGEVLVERAGTSTEGMELATIGAGGFFGEMTVIDGLPRSATVRAKTAVRCALLPRWGLEQAVRANPAVALEMLAVLSRRLRATERLLTH